MASGVGKFILAPPHLKQSSYSPCITEKLYAGGAGGAPAPHFFPSSMHDGWPVSSFLAVHINYHTNVARNV